MFEFEFKVNVLHILHTVPLRSRRIYSKSKILMVHVHNWVVSTSRSTADVSYAKKDVQYRYTCTGTQFL